MNRLQRLRPRRPRFRLSLKKATTTRRPCQQQQQSPEEKVIHLELIFQEALH